MKSIIVLAFLGLVSTYPLEDDCWDVSLKGDGYCNDENNVNSCDYDGGDCCNNNNNIPGTLCSECPCLDPNVDTTTPRPPQFTYVLFS